MTKKIESRRGVPATQLLSKLIEEWADRYPNDSKPHGSICATILKRTINPDTCLTAEQMDQIYTVLRTADGSNMDARAISLATYINSCRLECKKCINEKCTMRNTTTQLLNKLQQN